MLDYTIDYQKLNRFAKKVSKQKCFDDEVKEIISKYFQIPIDDFEEEKGLLKLNSYFYYLPVYLGMKKSENFDLHCVFSNPEKNVLLRWWINYVAKVGEDERERVVLVFKKNYQPILCLLLLTTYKDLLSGNFSRFYVKTVITFESEQAGEIFVICKFEDLLLERKKRINV